MGGADVKLLLAGLKRKNLEQFLFCKALAGQ